MKSRCPNCKREIKVETVNVEGVLQAKTVCECGYQQVKTKRWESLR